MLSANQDRVICSCSEAFESRLAYTGRSLSRFLKHEAARGISTSLNGMLVHRRSLPHNSPQFVRFSPTIYRYPYLYTWMERGTVRVKCLAQEHSTMSPARARTRTARSGVEHTNHEATTCILLLSLLNHFYYYHYFTS